MDVADRATAGIRSAKGALEAVVGLLGPDHFTSRPPTIHGARYGTRARGIPLAADVYLPDAREPRPSVVLVHGGGFVIGSRAMKPMRFIATRLADVGFAVMSIDYRMVFRGGRLDESVSDVADAIAWWHTRADEHGVDGERVAVMGLSAGATLAMLATAASPPASIDRLVCVFGLYDFTALDGWRATLAQRLLLQTADRAEGQRRSPIDASDRIAQPVLLVHGTADTLVADAQARALEQRRRNAGLPVDAVYIDGAPHGFFSDARHATAADDAMTAALSFLQRR